MAFSKTLPAVVFTIRRKEAELDFPRLLSFSAPLKMAVERPKAERLTRVRGVCSTSQLTTGAVISATLAPSSAKRAAQRSNCASSARSYSNCLVRVATAYPHQSTASADSQDLSFLSAGV